MVKVVKKDRAPINRTSLYNSIRVMPMSDRREMEADRRAKHWLSLLTPAQYAAMFPDYYKRALPDIGPFGKYYSGMAPRIDGGTAVPVPSSGGGSGVGGGSGGGSGTGSTKGKGTATQVKPDTRPGWMRKMQDATGIDPRVSTATQADVNTTTYNTLKSGRERFAKEMEEDPSLRETMKAMAMAEVGDGADLESIRGVMETMVNRAEAQGVTLAKILEKHENDKDNYYQPYKRGAAEFEKALQKLRENKDLNDKFDKGTEGVIAGSNDSNLATDNSSGGVASEAEQTQTITKKTTSGETLSRKDLMEYARGEEGHGVGVTKNNIKWAQEKQAGINAEIEQRQKDAMTGAPPDNSNKTGPVSPPNPNDGNIQKGPETGPDGKPLQQGAPQPGLPNGIDSKVQEYYNKLPEAAKPGFAGKINDAVNKLGGVEKFNDTVKEDVSDTGMKTPDGKKIVFDNDMSQSIIEQAKIVAIDGGPKAVEEFMNEQGYPKHENWCGDFAASVVKSVGSEPPDDPAIASNWRNYGQKVDVPQPGDIAVKKSEYHGRLGTGRTGDQGSHVTIVHSYDPEDSEKFQSIGGNQGKLSKAQPTEEYEFYRSTKILDEAKAKAQAEALAKQQKAATSAEQKSPQPQPDGSSPISPPNPNNGLRQGPNPANAPGAAPVAAPAPVPAPAPAPTPETKAPEQPKPPPPTGENNSIAPKTMAPEPTSHINPKSSLGPPIPPGAAATPSEQKAMLKIGIGFGGVEAPKTVNP